MLRAILSVLVVCLITSNALAQTYREAGDWFVRGGLGNTNPDGDGQDLGPGTSLDVDDAWAATITVAYMVTDHIGVELLAATPFKHDIKLSGAGDVADTKQLPPTLSAQWYFSPIGRFQPYVGAGINWTVFFNEDTKGALSGSTLNLNDSLGGAAQVGIDWHLNDKWLANFDLRYIDISTGAELDGASLGGVEIDPWVYSFRVGYTF